MSDGNIGGHAIGKADIHYACQSQREALENALIKAGADEQALQRRVAELEKALRDARDCMHGNDILRDGVRLSARIEALLPPVEEKG